MSAREPRCDLAVVGAPFLDLVFEGLPTAPAIDREILARRLLASVGGTGLQAIAASRTGAMTSLVAPRGTDRFGAWLDELLATEGIRRSGRSVATTPVTAVLPGPEGTAMVTAAPTDEPTPEEVASTRPAAVLLSLGRRRLAPAGARIFCVTGPAELEAGVTLDAAVGAEALIVNAHEAMALTGAGDADEATRGIAVRTPLAVVTLDRGGAQAIEDGQIVRVGPTTVSSGHATGAGDVFAGTLAASLVLGASLREALNTATLQATQAAAGATALDGLGPRPLTQP